jgi:hypothetical protein
MFSSRTLLNRNDNTPEGPWLPTWRAILGLGLILLATAAGADEPASPARELQKLIPPDASVVLTVEDLRGQVRELLASRLAAELQKLPTVKAWFDSEKYEQLETARDQIEGVLQAKLTEIRDQILGDAVVFALRLPAHSPFDPSQARGILALKAANPPLLRRLIDLINTTQKQNGEIAAVVERKRGDVSYFVREFPAGSDHLPEAYVTFPDGIFAISNGVDLIAEFIDLKARKADDGAHAPASLMDSPRFQALDHRLPARALARLYIDPRLAERLLKSSPRPRSPGEALIGRYIAALESAGAALVVREGHVTLQTAEIFEPRKFREVIGGGTARSTSTPPRLDRVPAKALAVGSLRVDFAALYRILLQLVPEPELPRLANAETALKGIFLGQDPRTRILPGLGPRILAFANAPADWEPGSKPDVPASRNWPFPSVVALELQADPDRHASSSKPAQPTVADALDNALNTLLALVTFDGKFAQSGSRIVSREVSGVTVKTLDPPVPFAYAVDRAGHRLVLGDSAGAVERYLASDSNPAAGARFRRLQALAFPDAHSFLCLDLAAVGTMMQTHRDRITGILANHEHRSRDEVAHDLDQFVALSRLFEAAYLTNRIDTDSATVFHALGLLARQPETDGSAPPKP